MDNLYESSGTTTFSTINVTNLVSVDVNLIKNAIAYLWEYKKSLLPSSKSVEVLELIQKLEKLIS